MLKFLAQEPHWVLRLCITQASAFESISWGLSISKSWVGWGGKVLTLVQIPRPTSRYTVSETLEVGPHESVGQTGVFVNLHRLSSMAGVGGERTGRGGGQQVLIQWLMFQGTDYQSL